jgi:hypothetical protein
VSLRNSNFVFIVCVLATESLLADFTPSNFVGLKAVKDFTTNFFTQAQNQLFSMKTEIAIAALYLT